MNKKQRKRLEKIEKIKNDIIRELGSLPYLIFSFVLCGVTSAAFTYWYVYMESETPFTGKTVGVCLFTSALGGIIFWIFLLLSVEWLKKSMALNEEKPDV